MVRRSLVVLAMLAGSLPSAALAQAPAEAKAPPATSAAPAQDAAQPARTPAESQFLKNVQEAYRMREAINERTMEQRFGIRRPSAAQPSPACVHDKIGC